MIYLSVCYQGNSKTVDISEWNWMVHLFSWAKRQSTGERLFNRFRVKVKSKQELSGIIDNILLENIGYSSNYKQKADKGELDWLSEGTITECKIQT